jgi:hypothetical protein
MRCESTIGKGRYRCGLYIVHRGEHALLDQFGNATGIYWNDEEED